jgi:predicted amidohydrolase
VSQQQVRVAAVQLQSGEDVAANLEQVSRWVGAAAEAGAKLVLLPENFAFFGPETVKAGHAEALDGPAGPIGERLRLLSTQHALTLIAGGMPELSADPARPYNTSVVFDPGGQVVARYRKAHLFDVDLPDGKSLRESAGTSRGDEVVVTHVAGLNVGLAICYDLRFSALFEAMARRGLDLVTLPAAFTETTGKDHWHVLLRARAIEWQCWVVAAAQWGSHPGGRRTYGHSLVVDPWGNVVADASNRPGIVVADIDLELSAGVRSSLPCNAHRRTF